MLKKFLFVSACCGLLAAPSVGALGPICYEYKGFERWGDGAYAESDGKMLTLSLTNRPTGWKVGSVYRAQDATAANMYFGSEYWLKVGVEEGFIKDATGTAKISETAVTCPVDTAYPYPVIRYEPYQYAIAFDANASPVSGSMAEQSGLSYTNTTTRLQPNAFTRTGYVFAGWTTAASGSGTVFADQATVGGEKFGVTADGQTVTLYAKWSAKSYTVAYNEAGGTAGSSRPTAVAYDEVFKVSAPTRTGYTFQGWTVSGHDATTARYGTSSSSVATALPSDGQIAASGDVWLKSLTPTADATVTLMARWEDNTRTIAVDAKGGTASSNSFTVVIGKRYDACGPLPTATWAEGKKLFAGWYTAASDGTRVQASDTVPQDVPSTLYAHWTNAAYSVRFDGNGSTDGTMADQTISFDTSTALTSNAFARTGYTFAGWAQTNTPTRVSFEDGATVKDLATRAGDVVKLLAVWTTNTYYVAFDANGGEGTMPPLTNLYDRAFTLPANRFTHNNKFMVFSEWRDGATGQTYAEGAEALNLTNAPFATVTLQAVWTNSLSALSQAMHCDNLNWQNDSGGANPWQVHGGIGVGHGTDSCVRQSNGDLFGQKILWAVVEPKTNESGTAENVSGTLSFWWKPTGAATTLRGGWSTARGTGLNDPKLLLTAPTDTWTNVTVHIEAEDSKPQYLELINATTSGEGYCCIDGMTWTPDGENPTPGESDRVEAASLMWTADGLELSFTGDARFAYHLRATDSLSPTNWYDFGPTNMGADAAQVFVIPFDAAAPQRFFKIETIQKPTP